MSKDGLYRVKGEPYRHKWSDDGSAYRLEQLSYQPGSLAMPPSDYLSTFQDMDKSFILVGERGSGFSTFRNWLQNQSGDWQVFNTSNFDSDAKGVWEKISRHESGKYILDRTYRGKANDPREEDKFLVQLAKILESPEWASSPDNRFICFTYDAKNLSNDQLYSAMSDRLHVYRLPIFTQVEIEIWLKDLLTIDKVQQLNQNLKRIGELVIELLGGQPQLTHGLFNLVGQSIKGLQLPGLEKLFESSGKKIRRNYSNVVNIWKKELYEYLKTSPSAKRSMKAFVNGNTINSDHCSTDETTLYLIGWLYQVKDDEWGIRSSCHRTWARQTLRGDLQ